MRITICSSVNLTDKIGEVADKLSGQGHEVEIPFYSRKILNGEMSLDEFSRIKDEKGDACFREEAGEDLIIRYYNMIKGSDAILVVNGDRKGIENYIGGNTFLEMGFAHVLGKRIFLLNPIPDMMYKDELLAMKPVILNGDLSRIN